MLCAGREGAFGLDDAYTAGRLLRAALGRRPPRRGLNDAAMFSLDLTRRYGERWLRPLMLSQAGANLASLGFREDVALAAQEDRFPVLPQFAADLDWLKGKGVVVARHNLAQEPAAFVAQPESTRASATARVLRFITR